ncbi:MAG: DUF7718 family protein [Candidatus Thorarchaeota archaeon]
MVQLECYFYGEWVPVVRYDTAHGFAHCDRLRPYEPTVKTRMVSNRCRLGLGQRPSPN